MATEDMTIPKAQDQPTELSVESAPRFQHKAERPKTSPYTSPIAQLIVGSEQKAYYVPRDLLYSQLTASLDSEDKIYLPDVDENTGHVLAHYLYTGTYQTLDSMATSASEELRTEFKRAVLAYITAISHKVHGLEQLAKEKIEHFGAEMNIIDIVEVIEEEYSKIPSDAIWFHDYFNLKADSALDVKTKADAAIKGKRTTNDTIEEEKASLAIYALFHRIENIALLRALAQCVLAKYHILGQAFIEISENLGTLSGDNRSRSSSVEETLAEGCVIAEEPPIETHIETEPIEEVHTQEVGTEEHIAVAESEAQTEERKDDAWAQWGSVAVNTKGKKSKKVPKVGNSLSSPLDPQPVDVLSPLEVEENLDVLSADWGAPSWSKKKKIKKALVPDALHGPPPENLPTEPSTSQVEVESGNKGSEDWWQESTWGGVGKKKKSKKGKKAEPAHEAVPEPTIDDAVPVQELGSTEVHYEKGEDQPNTEYRDAPEATESVQNPPTVKIIEETAPVPIEKPQDDPWGSPSLNIEKPKKKNKKKGLRSAKAAISISEIVEPSGPVSEDLVPATSAIPVEGVHIIPTDPVGLDNGNTNVHPEGGSEQHVEVQDEFCPLFNEHSQQGDQWKKCQQCQNYMHRVAVNQVHRSHPNEVKALWFPGLVR